MSHYKSYPYYKESGVEWLGEVPEHWDVNPLMGNFTQVKNLNKGLVCNNLLSLSYGRIIRKSIGKNEGLTPDSYETYNIVKKGDIILRLTDLQNDKRSLRTGFVEEEEGIITSAYLTIRPEDEWSSEHMHYLFHAYDIMKVFYGMGGGMRQSLTFWDMKRLPVLVPPKYEIEAITKVLKRETSRIDTLIKKKQRFIKLLKERRQALITKAVTKGLNPTVSMKDSGAEWLGEVPAHWAVKPLKLLIAKGSSISYGIVQPGEALDDGVPFVQTTNMTKGSFSIDELQKTSAEIASAYPRSSLQGGEVLLGIRASIGAAHIAPDSLAGANLSRGVARIECSDQIYNEFLLFFLQSKSAEEYWWFARQGSTFNEVSIATVKNNPIPMPSAEEQRKIVAHLKCVTQEIDLLVDKTQRSIDLLKERRAALITAAVTGKIDLRSEVEPKHDMEVA